VQVICRTPAGQRPQPPGRERAVRALIHTKAMLRSVGNSKDDLDHVSRIAIVFEFDAGGSKVDR